MLNMLLPLASQLLGQFINQPQQQTGNQQQMVNNVPLYANNTTNNLIDTASSFLGPLGSVLGLFKQKNPEYDKMVKLQQDQAKAKQIQQMTQMAQTPLMTQYPMMQNNMYNNLPLG